MMFGIEAMMGFVQSEFPWRSVLANSVLKGDYDVTLFGGRIAFYAITTIHQSIPSQTLSPKPLVYRCIGANAFIGTCFAGAVPWRGQEIKVVCTLAKIEHRFVRWA